MRISDWSSDVCSSDLLVANGYVLNNELTDFTFAPEKDGKPVANRVEGNKRPLSSMSPTIVYGPDRTVILAPGSAVGHRIIQHVPTTPVGAPHWGLSATDAITHPHPFFKPRGRNISDDA